MSQPLLARSRSYRRYLADMRRPAAIVVIYIAVYVFLDWISYVLPVAPLGISPWNPPPGASFALLLRYGTRYWPALWFASIAAELVVRGLPSPLPLLCAAVVITAVYSSAAAMLRRRLGDGWRIETSRELYLFIAVVSLATAIVAVTYVAIFAAAGEVPWTRYTDYALRFWVGDLDGVLVATPLVLIRPTRLWRKPALRPLLEMLLQAGAISVMLWVIFRVTIFDEFKSFYLLFLPLIWVAARWQSFGAVLALLWIQLGLIVAVQTEDYDASIFAQLQFLMLMLCITGLALGMYVSERAVAFENLRSKQASLDRALQFAAAGELSSALAHELNQPITALSNYLQICRLLVEQGRAGEGLMTATLDKAMAEGMRASNVVRRLRDFFRSGTSTLVRTDLESLLLSIAASFQPRALAAGVDFRLLIDGPLAPVLVDPVQIETAVNNLLNNALDAVGGDGNTGGEIRLSAAAARSSVELSINDNGPGLSTEIAGRLFEPFCTTKPQGMGLGLAISRTLVEGHGGRLWYETRSGGGCRFRLRLPAESALGDDRQSLPTPSR